jgi:diguanylate cyclase (GGDEF)-like protein
VVSNTREPSVPPDQACLVVIYGDDLGRKFAIAGPSIVIGRSSRCAIQVHGESVSRRHCRVDVAASEIFLSDTRSTNGTYVNDRPIEREALSDGDIIGVGRTIFKFLTGANIERAYHEEIYRLSTVDGLTQVHNRRFFVEAVERELSRGRRYGRQLSIVLLDIDHFKVVNDTYGHVAGDRILSELATLISGSIRREDVMARYGGEEFALLLPELDRTHAKQFAEKIRQLVRMRSFASAPRPFQSRSASASPWPTMMSRPRPTCWNRPIDGCTRTNMRGATASADANPDDRRYRPVGD